MKKLLLITSLIPLSLSPTIGLFTSCSKDKKQPEDKPVIDYKKHPNLYLKNFFFELILILSISTFS